MRNRHVRRRARGSRSRVSLGAVAMPHTSFTRSTMEKSWHVQLQGSCGIAMDSSFAESSGHMAHSADMALSQRARGIVGGANSILQVLLASLVYRFAGTETVLDYFKYTDYCARLLCVMQHDVEHLDIALHALV